MMCSSDTEYLPSCDKEIPDRGHRIYWHLLPWLPLVRVAKVFTIGAKKHRPEGWKDENTVAEQFGAAMGHLSEFIESKGQAIDTDTGMSPLFNAIARLLVLAWHHMRGTLKWE